jgi:FMN-dependent NADH-azoreductase
LPKLLRIDASSRLSGSHSRDLADAFEHAWRARGTDHEVVRRDLVASPVPQIEQTTIAGFYTPPDQMTPELRSATALSDELIGEVLAADELLIATPMYNFTVPSALKAWIDQIVRVGNTFAFDGVNFKGLVKARRAVVISAYGAGGYLNGGAFAAADFCGPYLKFLLNFLGITAVDQISVEATVGDADALSGAISAAKERIALAAAA